MIKNVPRLELHDGNFDVHPNQVDVLQNFANHVIYEDSDMLVVNKPPHVSSQWDDTHGFSLTEIAQYWRGPETSPVHRLDRLTSGLVILGATAQAKRNFGKQFERKSAGDSDELQKKYLAMVRGDFGDEDQLVEHELDIKRREVEVVRPGKLGAKLARTAISKVTDVRTNEDEARSLLLVKLLTGRKHQIRVALKSLGMPIIDDPVYNPQRGKGRLRLHAHAMRILHPVVQQPLHFRAPLPDDFFSDTSAQERGRVDDAVAQIAA